MNVQQRILFSAPEREGGRGGAQRKGRVQHEAQNRGTMNPVLQPDFSPKKGSCNYCSAIVSAQCKINSICFIKELFQSNRIETILDINKLNLSF